VYGTIVVLTLAVPVPVPVVTTDEEEVVVALAVTLEVEFAVAFKAQNCGSRVSKVLISASVQFEELYRHGRMMAWSWTEFSQWQVMFVALQLSEAMAVESQGPCGFGFVSGGVLGVVKGATNNAGWDLSGQLVDCFVLGCDGG